MATQDLRHPICRDPGAFYRHLRLCGEGKVGR
jgi:hypothetical protein